MTRERIAWTRTAKHDARDPFAHEVFDLVPLLGDVVCRRYEEHA